MNKITMDRKDIIDTIRTLACSQGFYGRLLEQLNSLDTADYNAVMNELEKQKFTCVLDLIMYFEC